MSVVQLLNQSLKLYEQHNIMEQKGLAFFTNGAQWMHQYLEILASETKPFPNYKFELIGYIKYGLSLLTALGVCAFYPFYSWWLIPMAAFIFYVVEVHFLFLFPLAIDGESNLIRRTLKATYQFGFWKAYCYTVCIAGYMLFGLLDFKSPLKKWRIGCLAIVILYQREIRNRA